MAMPPIQINFYYGDEEAVIIDTEFFKKNITEPKSVMV
jgi:hypothetical protein